MKNIKINIKELKPTEFTANGNNLLCTLVIYYRGAFSDQIIQWNFSYRVTHKTQTSVNSGSKYSNRTVTTR